MFFFQFPVIEEDWRKVAHGFEKLWNYPNCLGAVDGKHVKIVPPANSGSYYFNYKGSHSLVLMAIGNANYEFLMCDFGVNGRISDGGVIEKTLFYQMLRDNHLNIPTPTAPQNSSTALSFVFIGDEAFTLRKDFMKPFSQKELNHDRKIFNYTLSRARRVIENIFGILWARFRIFNSPINMNVGNIESVVIACCVLHNFLRKRKGDRYMNADEVEDPGQNEQIIGLQGGYNRRAGQEAKEVREQYLRYFCTDGAVQWQESKI